MMLGLNLLTSKALRYKLGDFSLYAIPTKLPLQVLIHLHPSGIQSQSLSVRFFQNILIEIVSVSVRHNKSIRQPESSISSNTPFTRILGNHLVEPLLQSFIFLLSFYDLIDQSMFIPKICVFAYYNQLFILSKLIKKISK